MSKRSVRALLAVLSLAGLTISAYPIWSYFEEIVPMCCMGQGGCEIVQSSPYSTIFGISLTAFGIVGSATLVSSALIEGKRGAIFGLAAGVAGVILAALRMW